MPKIKDFEKAKKMRDGASEIDEFTTSASSSNKRRRPGRDVEEAMDDVKVIIVETSEEPVIADSTVASNLNSQTSEEPSVESSGPKVEIKFPGSEILRAKFSKPFQVAESIATDWMNDGKFEDIPLGHPLAQYFAAKGLQKAKDVERKVLESPITEKVAMQALQAGMKAQEIITQVRAKLKK